MKTPRKTIRVPVMLCVNDADNGMHTGTVSAIEIDNCDTLHLYCTDMREPVCDIDDENCPTRLKLSRRWFPIRSYAVYVGNWCWDCAWMDFDVAVDLLAYLQSMKHGDGSPKWDCEDGESRLFDKWKAGEPITREDLWRVLVTEKGLEAA